MGSKGDPEPVFWSPCHERAVARGRKGEQFLYEELTSRLRGTGLEVRLATEQNFEVPFDLEVLDGDRILVGIENKDLAASTKGTWIKHQAKTRKLAYAQEKGIKLIVTTITRRDISEVAFREGLVNGVPAIFERGVERLVKRVLLARKEAAACP